MDILNTSVDVQLRVSFSFFFCPTRALSVKGQELDRVSSALVPLQNFTSRLRPDEILRRYQSCFITQVACLQRRKINPAWSSILNLLLGQIHARNWSKSNYYENILKVLVHLSPKYISHVMSCLKPNTALSIFLSRLIWAELRTWKNRRSLAFAWEELRAWCVDWQSLLSDSSRRSDNHCICGRGARCVCPSSVDSSPTTSRLVIQRVILTIVNGSSIMLP